jgi:Zn-dependent peptidase ImmA (M78 family)/DNA-binding XRE family transcriptional regulator
MLNPPLLRVAREALGLTQSDLANAASVDQAEISRWERGSRQPGPEQFDRLASVLQVRPGFLSQDARVTRPVHRTARVSSKRAQRLVDARLELARLVASRLFREIEVDVPFGFPTADDPAPPDPETAAAAVRRVWRIPAGPVEQLTAHVEAAGAIVLPVDFGTGTVLAAYAHIPGDDRWCFINVRATDGPRMRFSLAHEIGHALLHWDRFDAPYGADAEREAHQFAAALLMPAADMESIFGGTRLDLDDLVPLRREWGVSIQALVMRAEELGLITFHKKRRLFQQLGSRGWRTHEPGPTVAEQPTLFSESVDLLRTVDGLTDEDLVDISHLPQQRLADLFPDCFSASAAPRPHLRAVG